MKTLAANVAGQVARRKKENPYLSHRTSGGQAAAKAQETATVTTGTTVEGGGKAVAAPPVAVDERLKTSSRDVRAKRTFNFVEAGKFLDNCCVYLLSGYLMSMGW